MLCPLALALTITTAQPDTTQYLAVHGSVMAVRKGGKWSSLPEELPEKQVGSWKFHGFGIGKKLGSTLVTKLETGPVGGFFAFAPGREEPIARNPWVSGRPASVPRAVTSLPLNSSVYLPILKAICKAEKLPGTPKLAQCLKVDLNGDGRDELILAGTNGSRESMYDFERKLSPSNPLYSGLWLRSVDSAGRVKTEKLMLCNAKGDGALFEWMIVEGIADIDGDGKMELVTSAEYYEGISAFLWSFDGKTTKQLAGGGFGA